MRGVTLMVVVLLTGCAHALTDRPQLAKSSAYLCKHCNCFMPADIEAHVICPVCDCGYPAHGCRRGQ